MSLLGSALSLSFIFWASVLLHNLDPLFDLVEVPGCVDPKAERFNRLWLSGSVLSQTGRIGDLVLWLAFHCAGVENLALGQVEVSVPDQHQSLSDLGDVGVGCPLIWLV